MKYNYAERDGYETGDMGKGKPKTKRIFRVDRIDQKNQLAYCSYQCAWGGLYEEIIPLFKIEKMDEEIER